MSSSAASSEPGRLATYTSELERLSAAHPSSQGARASASEHEQLLRMCINYFAAEMRPAVVHALHEEMAAQGVAVPNDRAMRLLALFDSLQSSRRDPDRLHELLPILKDELDSRGPWAEMCQLLLTETQVQACLARLLGPARPAELSSSQADDDDDDDEGGSGADERDVPAFQRSLDEHFPEDDGDDAQSGGLTLRAARSVAADDLSNVSALLAKHSAARKRATKEQARAQAEAALDNVLAMHGWADFLRFAGAFFLHFQRAGADPQPQLLKTLRAPSAAPEPAAAGARTQRRSKRAAPHDAGHHDDDNDDDDDDGLPPPLEHDPHSVPPPPPLPATPQPARAGAPASGPPRRSRGTHRRSFAPSRPLRGMPASGLAAQLESQFLYAGGSGAEWDQLRDMSAEEARALALSFRHNNHSSNSASGDAAAGSQGGMVSAATLLAEEPLGPFTQAPVADSQDDDDDAPKPMVDDGDDDDRETVADRARQLHERSAALRSQFRDPLDDLIAPRRPQPPQSGARVAASTPGSAARGAQAGQRGGSAKRRLNYDAAESPDPFESQFNNVHASGASHPPVPLAALQGDSFMEMVLKTADGKKRRKKPEPWTIAETQALKDGVAALGVGNWAQILMENLGAFNSCRTSVSLKDKWRNVKIKEEKEQPAHALPGLDAASAAE